MNKNILKLIEDPTKVRGISANIITGSCGAYFFNSLFDEHPEILPINIHAVPSELDNYYYYYMGRFSKELAFNVDHYTKCIDSWNIPSTYAAHFGVPDKYPLMREIMREAFMNLKDNLTYNHLYYIQYIALAAILDYPLSTTTPIIFQHRHIFNPHYFQEGYTKLDTSFYINYFRLIRRPEKSLDQIYLNVKSTVLGARAYQPSYPFLFYYYDDLIKYFSKEKLWNIRFEDLHLQPEETLRACCAQMGISYIPEVLLKSTYQGKPFVFSNRRTGKPETTFSKERGLEEKTYHISGFYKFLLNYFLEKFYIFYKYKNNRSRLYKLVDMISPLLFLLLLMPTITEIKNLIRFYLEYWRAEPNSDIRNKIHTYNNFMKTINKLPFFEFLAIDKTKKEKFILKIKFFTFWAFFIPVIDLFRLKLKIALCFTNYRFKKRNFALLINEFSLDSLNISQPSQMKVEKKQKKE